MSKKMRQKNNSLTAAGALAAGVSLVCLFGLFVRSTPAAGQLPEAARSVRQSSSYPPEVVIPGDFIAFFVKAERLYTVGDGLSIYDVGNVFQPAYLGGLAGLPTYFNEVYVAGDHGYIPSYDPGLYTSGLDIVNIADPANPTSAGFYAITGVRKVVVRDPYAFAIYSYSYTPSVSFGGLVVLDVTEPSDPTQVSSLNLSRPLKLTFEGDEGYISDVFCSYSSCVYFFKTIDIADPTNPAVLGSINTFPYQIQDHDTAPGLAALGVVNYEPFQLEYAVHFYDITDPAMPMKVGEYETSFLPESVLLHEHYAFVAGLEEIWLLDVSDPTQPEYLGHYPYGAQEMQIYEGSLFVLTPEGDIRVLRYDELSISGWVGQPNGLPAPDLGIELNIGLFTGSFTGTYGYIGMPIGTYTISLWIPGYAYTPTYRTVQLPPSAPGQNFTVLPEPVSILVNPGMSNTLVYTDIQGVATHLSIPTNTLTATLTLTVTPTLAPSGNGLYFTGHGFTLDAAVGGMPQAAYTFTAPLSLTVELSAGDLLVISDTTAVELYHRVDGAWQAVPATCGANPAPVGNALVRSVCRTGTYTVYGPTWQLGMPLVVEE